MPQAAHTGRLPDLDPRQATALLDGGDAILLDVRQSHEWAAGHAARAQHLPLDRLDPGSVSRDRTIIVVCRSENRSGTAADALAPAGIRVHNLAGGMKAWAAAGLPVVTDGGEPGTVA